MNPVECAARAIYAAAQPEWEWDDPYADHYRQFYRKAARAVIDTLRDPGAEGIQAGADIVDAAHPGSVQRAQATWQAMIDAILAQD